MHTVRIAHLLICFAVLCALFCPAANAIHGEAKRKLSEGYEALRHADYVKANDCFLEALKLTRAQGESHEAIDFLKVELAANDARLGNPARALVELNAIQEIYDLRAKREGHKSLWYNHLLRAKALCYSKQKKYDSAIRVYKEIVQNEDKNDARSDNFSGGVETRVQYVKALMLKGEHQEAQEVLNDLIARQNSTEAGKDVVFQAEGMLAHSYFAQKKYAEVEKHVQVALSIKETKADRVDSREGYLKLLLAQTLEEQRKHAEAAPLFKEAEDLLIKSGRVVPIEFYEAYEKCLKSLSASDDLERVRNRVAELKKKGKADGK